MYLSSRKLIWNLTINNGYIFFLCFETTLLKECRQSSKVTTNSRVMKLKWGRIFHQQLTALILLISLAHMLIHSAVHSLIGCFFAHRFHWVSVYTHKTKQIKCLIENKNKNKIPFGGKIPPEITVRSNPPPLIIKIPNGSKRIPPGNSILFVFSLPLLLLRALILT